MTTKSLLYVLEIVEDKPTELKDVKLQAFRTAGSEGHVAKGFYGRWSGVLGFGKPLVPANLKGLGVLGKGWLGLCWLFEGSGAL